MHGRLEPASSYISDTFRNEDSGLDSGHKQGQRCVNEHAYE